MLSGVEIICFTATYLLVFVLELARFFYKIPARNTLRVVLTVLGLIAQSAYLYHHQITLESTRLVNNVQGFFFLLAWGLVLIDLYLFFFHPKIPFGLFLFPIVLGLIAGGTFWAKTTPLPVPVVGQTWRFVHGIAFLLATLSVFFGFVCGLMYFEQKRRLKRKQISDSGFKLPSLEWSKTACTHGIGFSLTMLTIGIFSGILLNHLIALGGKESVSFVDPLVGGTLVLFLFLIAFLGTLAVYRPAEEGSRIALLTLLSFLFLVCILVFALLSGTAHWSGRA